MVGQAIVIFTSRETAEKALYQLEKRCLMLPNGRCANFYVHGAFFLVRVGRSPKLCYACLFGIFGEDKFS